MACSGKSVIWECHWSRSTGLNPTSQISQRTKLNRLSRALRKGNQHMNSKQQTAIKERKMEITPSTLIRWAGLPAVAAGLFFAAIQPIHPADALASVTTDAWAIITPLKVVMCLFFLLGITGIYARQMKKAGWLGLVGFLLLSLAWALELAFIFAEAFIIPLLATSAPTFVEGFFGIVNGHAIEANLGALPALYALLSVLYIL